MSPSPNARRTLEVAEGYLQAPRLAQAVSTVAIAVSILATPIHSMIGWAGLIAIIAATQSRVSASSWCGGVDQNCMAAASLRIPWNAGTSSIDAGLSKSLSVRISTMRSPLVVAVTAGTRGTRRGPPSHRVSARLYFAGTPRESPISSQ